MNGSQVCRPPVFHVGPPVLGNAGGPVVYLRNCGLITDLYLSTDPRSISGGRPPVLHVGPPVLGDAGGSAGDLRNCWRRAAQGRRQLPQARCYSNGHPRTRAHMTPSSCAVTRCFGGRAPSRSTDIPFDRHPFIPTSLSTDIPFDRHPFQLTSLSADIPFY